MGKLGLRTKYDRNCQVWAYVPAFDRSKHRQLKPTGYPRVTQGLLRAPSCLDADRLNSRARSPSAGPGIRYDIAMRPPTYLSAACFVQPNAGPPVFGRYGEPLEGERNPSRRQILSRCRAIRDGWSEREKQCRRIPHLDGMSKEEACSTRWLAAARRASSKDAAAAPVVE